MHPAKSVIFFTTASGAGYGLLVLFILLDLAGQIPADTIVTWSGLGCALGLVTAGLLSSTLHLGHPERAWRALSQWRSSWLSREGLLAMITFVPCLIYGAGRLTAPGMDLIWQPLTAAIAVACALLTVYCTAMIYASLKPIPAWSNAWTPVCYVALALSSGGVLLTAFSFAFGFTSVVIVTLACILLVVGLISKLAYWHAIGSAPPRSTAESATGLGGIGTVHLFEAPHEGDNYLLTEMGFRIARKHAARLRRLAVLWGFILPLIAILMTRYSDSTVTVGLIGFALVTALMGLLAERYLFFAEAKHAVMLYYGDRSV